MRFEAINLFVRAGKIFGKVKRVGGIAVLMGWALCYAVPSQSATTVYAKDYGFNTEDATVALQKAIDSKADRVIVSNMGANWIVRPIQMVSNQEIVLESGVVVEAKRGEYHGINDSVFNATHQKNITVRGYGAVLKMHREDYTAGGSYAYSQWRHVFYFMSCDNVKVYGVEARDSGGDGIFVGSYEGQPACTDFHIKDVLCDNNYRQGISVTNVENIVIESSRMNNTWGQEPQAGLDLEPDGPTHRLVNVVVRNCRFENNNAAGLHIYPQMMNSTTAPMSVKIQNCYITSANGWGIQYSPAWLEHVGGTIEFENCTIENTKGPGLFMLGKYAYSANLIFKRCTWRNTAQEVVNGLPAHPFVLSGQFADRVPDYGGIEFQDSLLEDGGNRPFLKTLEPADSKGVANLKGTLTVLNPNGANMDLGAKAHDIDLRILTDANAENPAGAQPVMSDSGGAVGDIAAGVGATAGETLRQTAAVAAAPTAYPNPATDRIIFRFDSGQTAPADVRLYNLAGELTAEISGPVSSMQPSLVCDVQHLAPGVYLYLANHGGRTDKGKICIVKRN